MIMKAVNLITILIFCSVIPVAAEQKAITETITTSAGDLVITFVGHASLIMSYNDNVIHVDPFSKMADYAKMHKADIIIITHEHSDHLDLQAVHNIKKPQAKIIGTNEVAKKIPGIIVMKNGETQTVEGLRIEAVPAYNIVHMRAPGKPYHPKGVGNGYVITFGDKRVYIAGDTENTPEMKKLKDIDVAFLPMNLPYTMSPEMVADAVKSFKPKILYPYHFSMGETNMPRLQQLLKDEQSIELRVRGTR